MGIIELPMCPTDIVLGTLGAAREHHGRLEPLRARILVADDEPDVLEALAMVLEAEGHEVVRATSIEESLARIADERPDLAFLDLRMPGRETLSALPEMLATDPALPIVIVTGFGTIHHAVEAMRAGAYDFLEKPIRRDILLPLLARALEHRRLRKELARLRSATARGSADGLLGSSARMANLREEVRRVAASQASALIVGESGTGKELVARAIHLESERSQGPWIAVNCAALAAPLLEAELFGYERGAFTGADPAGREGLFEQAHGGTLFLDEVGEMEISLQAKLLRALEERRIRRLGGRSDRAVDLRVVSASNRDLRRAIEEQRFRSDLYFRLAVVTISVPPLRERDGDVLELAQHFLKALPGATGRTFSPEAVAALRSHRWPGNVRELRNAVERAVIVSRGAEILASDLALGPATSSDAAPSLAVRPLAEVERDLVLAAMRETGNNISLAARRLGIHRATLHRKLQQIEEK